MIFTKRQLAHLQTGLNRYRFNRGKNGNARSWRRVALDVVQSLDEAANALAPNTINIRGEALRRFGKGETTSLTDASLNVLYRYLLYHEVIDESIFELSPEEADQATITAIIAMMANNGEESLSYLRSLHPVYVADEFKPKSEIHLSFDLSASGKFVEIEEHVRVRGVVGLHEGWADKKDERRYGFGFTTTMHNLLHIFLRGYLPGDWVTYVQADPDKDGGESFLLMRSGPDKWNPGRPATQFDYMRPRKNMHQFKFLIVGRDTFKQRLKNRERGLNVY